MKILTWNVQWFCGLDGVVSVERVLHAARALADFDVICLQEVAVNYPRLTGGAGFDQVQCVREHLPGFEVCFGASVEELGRGGERQRFGNLVASRLPVAQVQHLLLPYPADGGVPSMPRMCTSATVLAPWGPLRVMTTHLEYHSPRLRLAQAVALAEWHAQCCGHAAAPPADDESGEPYQNKPHTVSAVLCGDFNFDARSAGYAKLQREVAPPVTRLVDAWPLARPGEPHAPSFCVHERRYGPQPVACDFVFVSEDLAPRVRGVEVDTATRASDHQPVLLSLG
jgi:endonuclease/exonuclease/phosphatase family metal-dependent hydrolase